MEPTLNRPWAMGIIPCGLSRLKNDMNRRPIAHTGDTTSDLYQQGKPTLRT